MKTSQLGCSGIAVSRVCLGSMTWGLQNTQQDADQQIEFAINQGINFIDTAELYSVPPSEEKYGATEEIIGNWLSRNPHQRNKLVIASKIAGPGLSYIRGGGPVTGETVKQAVEGSLKRLQTDYIDLFQIHWPNRNSPHFGRHFPNQLRFSQVDVEQQTQSFVDILSGLKSCVDAGKIRYCGLSNETPWGVSQYLKLAKSHDLPQMVSVQNEFSLLQTKDSPYLLEQCVFENLAYLPWSPLAGGMLSGKYLNGARPEGSRWTISQRNGLFRDTEKSEQAVQQFKALAEQFGMTTAQLALAWCNQVDGVTSTIIGATNLTQLKENIDAFAIELSAQQQSLIMQVIQQYTVPF
jgi:aryl-alcohol dehydrogenase-like predicted oxidoreductase